jgi:N-acetyl-anhydromuramyl-L-alanine amidase AmpD
VKIEGGAVAYPFVESPNVTKTAGRKIDLIVIHTMEMDEKGETAEQCARWFANPAAQASAHYCVDADSIVQCVRDQDVAWHAPVGVTCRRSLPRICDSARVALRRRSQGGQARDHDP